MTKLLLASSSPYRRELLARLGMPFTWASPAVAEKRLPEEQAAAMVERLAREKAQALLTSHPEHIIIGSDQAASLDEEVLGKPMNAANAVEQLLRCSGRTVTFFTAICVTAPDQPQQTRTNTTLVRFRQLSRSQAEYYIRKEQPLDCAGSFKCEGLGITLFESISSDDPTALIGLPLIQLTSMLINVGVDPLASDAPSS